MGFVPPPPGTYGAPFGTPSKPTNSDAVIALVLAIATMSTTLSLIHISEPTRPY